MSTAGKVSKVFITIAPIFVIALVVALAVILVYSGFTTCVRAYVDFNASYINIRKGDLLVYLNCLEPTLLLFLVASILVLEVVI